MPRLAQVNAASRLYAAPVKELAGRDISNPKISLLMRPYVAEGFDFAQCSTEVSA